MSKIGIKELAQVFTEKFDLDAQTAERFIATAFDTLGHGLEAERQVKVKGLGTFKVLAIAPRKSVDVNTGEAIVIEGRDKISFTPENAMRDQVNRPFEQFITVELNDGVDFSEIDQRFLATEVRTTEQEMAPVPEPVSELEPEPVSELEPEPVSEPMSALESNPTPEQGIQTASVPSSDADPQPDFSPVSPTPEPIVTVDSQAAPSVDEAEEKTLQEEAEKAKGEKEEEEEETVEESKDEDEDEDEQTAFEAVLTRQHRLVNRLIVAVVALFILGVGAAAYLCWELDKRDNRIRHLETQITTSQPAGEKAKAPAPVSAPSDPDAIAAANDAQQAEDEQLKSTAESSVASSATRPVAIEQSPTPRAVPTIVERTEIPDQSAYAKDARVRTGAYYIMGIDHKVTVREGETLYSLSRRVLGPGMECYIEAVNGGRREFKAGEAINIPKLKVKKRKK